MDTHVRGSGPILVEAPVSSTNTRSSGSRSGYASNQAWRRAATSGRACSGGPGWVAADKGHSSDALRAQVWDRSARPAIPTKRN